MNILCKLKIMAFSNPFPALVTIVMSAGCAVGPDYVQPEPSMHEAWCNELKGGLFTQETDPKKTGKLVEVAQQSPVIEFDRTSGFGRS